MDPLPSVADYVAGVGGGDRTWIGRALTLVESTHPEHRPVAAAVLEELAPRAGEAVRVGITGVPGAGKSTFIEAMGTRLTGQGHRVAVMAVDPSSAISGGSILGDKTRMTGLATDPAAFIRPTPAAGAKGGVARTTRETIVVLEAAGHDVVLVETVGVGQSEAMVAEMVDFFLLLLIPGAGDELQGIKRGVLELADMVAVNKADGETAPIAAQTAQDYGAALRLLRPLSPDWTPPVVTCSAVEGTGLDRIWSDIIRHREIMAASGELVAKRQTQQLGWMWSLIDERLGEMLRASPAAAEVLATVEPEVRAGSIPAGVAADRVVDAFMTGTNSV